MRDVINIRGAKNEEIENAIYIGVDRQGKQLFLRDVAVLVIVFVLFQLRGEESVLFNPSGNPRCFGY